MYTTWVSHAHHMVVTCTPHGYHMYSTWDRGMLGCHSLGNFCTSSGSSTLWTTLKKNKQETNKCTLHGCHMHITWVSHAHHMVVTGTPHGYHMYITWDRGMLGCHSLGNFCTSSGSSTLWTTLWKNKQETNKCTLHGCHMHITWLSHAHHMGITCTAHGIGGCLVVTL